MTVASAGVTATPAGPPGKSAYDLAVEQGFVGDVDTWLASLNGADGVGMPGAAGAQGPPGQPSIASVANASGPVPAAATYVGVRGIPSGGLDLNLPTSQVHGTGTPLIVVDETGTCSPTNPIRINVAVGDNIIGDTTLTMTQPYQKITLHSSGTSLWT